jgi:hypothetical protein
MGTCNKAGPVYSVTYINDFLTDQAGDFAMIANARDVAATRPSGRAGLE